MFATACMTTRITTGSTSSTSSRSDRGFPALRDRESIVTILRVAGILCMLTGRAGNRGQSPPYCAYFPVPEQGRSGGRVIPSYYANSSALRVYPAHRDRESSLATPASCSLHFCIRWESCLRLQICCQCTLRLHIHCKSSLRRCIRCKSSLRLICALQMLSLAALCGRTSSLPPSSRGPADFAMVKSYLLWSNQI